MKALITGIDGFTGRYLAGELASVGHEVVGISAFPQGQEPSTVMCDICDGEAIKAAVARFKPDLVFHLAAIAFVAHGDVDNIYRTNIVGSRNLLAALAACSHKPQGVLLVSSANVYGNATEGMIDETVVPAPANDYAVSKLAMEHMARLWADRLPINFVRPFNYTGVGQSTQFLLPKIVDHFKRRAPRIELGNLDVIRDFSDVRMVAHCYRRLSEVSQTGEAFNICSGVGHSLMEIVEIMRRLSGHDLEVVVNPAFVRANDPHKLIGSRAKLERVIGPFAPMPIEDTLRWMLEAG